MTFTIGIEDLVANALIENLKQGSEKGRFISYSEIESYGAKVVKLLTDEGNEAVLIFSRATTNQMLRDYSNFFEETIVKDESGIQLKSSVTIGQLIDTFRGYLTLTLLQAYIKSYKEENA